jgi:hypothetical protein
MKVIPLQNSAINNSTLIDVAVKANWGMDVYYYYYYCDAATKPSILSQQSLNSPRTSKK